MVDCDSTNLTIWIGFGVTIATLAYNGWNASAARKHTIALTDKKLEETTRKLEYKADHDRQQLAELVLQTTEGLHAANKTRADAVTQQMQEIAQTAAAAYKEANSINSKIADLHLENAEASGRLERTISALKASPPCP